MAIIKCKMCGGDMEISADNKIAVCEYCGSMMTIPKVDDEQRASIFNRGNQFRRAGEFDKALSVYEQIVRQDDTDAEAHWCCALCRFGIEYVEDPASYEWLPTCHRASFDSFLEDVDYLAALEHSDGITRRQYQKDAAKIAEVQRGILATSQSTEPYDVFISYKELNDNGSRTRDSILAQDIYYQLTEQGRRVFFSRITLEDIPGTQYEPYIFAALNSAKVMIVVGTSAENLNSVWVKNEWSRYLAMMRKDRSKLLIPCYRDMDPYDLPEQLSVLMSYDMGRIGFIQDLIRGVNKVLDAEKEKAPVKETVKETVIVQNENGANYSALLKRGLIALDDGEWDKADEFFERVLDQDAECSDAYFGKFLEEVRYKNAEEYVSARLKATERAEREKLAACAENTDTIENAVKKYEVKGYYCADKIRKAFEFDRIYFSELSSRKAQLESEMRGLDENKSFSRAERYGTASGESLAVSVRSALRNELEKRVENAADSDSRTKAQKVKDYSAHIENALKRIEENSAAAAERKAKKEREEKEKRIAAEKAAEEKRLAEARAAEQRKIKEALAAEQKRLEKEQRAEQKRHEKERMEKKSAVYAVYTPEKRRKSPAVKTVIVLLAVAVTAAAALFVMANSKYNAAVENYNNGRYEEALAVFTELHSFKDSEERIAACENAINEALKLNAEASAAAEPTAGILEELTYEIADGEATITGCDKSAEEIVIPAEIEGCPVMAIGDNAFSNCSSLISVTIPDSVTDIGNYTFYDCSSLVSVTIPDSVTAIGSCSFSGCSRLTSVTIPDGMTTIGYRAFYGCSGLTSVTIPDGVTDIGSCAFLSCSELTSVTIPDGVTTIGNGAFSNCSSLTSVTIPDGVTVIEVSAFSGCSGLTSVTIPDSVTAIKAYAFHNCDSLSKVYYSGTQRQLSKIVINGWNKALVGAEIIFENIPDELEYKIADGEAIITGCDKKATKIVIPDEIGGCPVTTIGNYTFSNCSSLISVTIPDSVTDIGNYTFYGCSSLTSVTIPDGVTTIGSYAFYCCSGLTSVTIPDSVTTIGSCAFSDCGSLTSVTIPDSVTTIGNYTFSGCSRLTSVTIPDGVTTIQEGAFNNCGSLSKVHYSGTQEQWNEIEIGGNNNALTYADMICENAQGS